MNTNLELVPVPLYRSEDNDIFLGVCAGIAERFNLAAWAVRLALILSILIFGTGLLFYIVCAVSMPKKSQVANAKQKKILGVCLRLSQKLNIDIAILRIATILLALTSLGFVVLIYLFLNFILDDMAAKQSSKSMASKL